MIILKFTLVLFLVALTAAMVERVNSYPPVGGPYYFADRPGPNPVRPSTKLSAFRALRSKRHIRAYYDRCSRLVLERHMKGKEELYRVEYQLTRDGALRWRAWSSDGRVYRVDLPGEP